VNGIEFVNILKLESSAPLLLPKGMMFRATRKSFPVLDGLSMQSFHLEPGGMREPHLHPDAAQLDYLISGKARVGIIGPEGRQLLDMESGDVCFIPQGHLHWIENTGDVPLHFLLTLSHEDPQTVELSALNAGAPGSGS
jgi:oxalate decarboxylase/phosphoglucose isomerase-like protein (cupin superfamily)